MDYIVLQVEGGGCLINHHWAELSLPSLLVSPLYGESHYRQYRYVGQTLVHNNLYIAGNLQPKQE